MYTTSKNWERFFYLTTWFVQGSSFLVPRAYGVMHRMHHVYSDTEKEKKREVLNRLREIYNERFGIIVTEDHTQFTNYERFELLKKLGIEDSALYKKLSNTGKHHLVGKILGIHKDNARKVIDGTYTAGGLDTEKIETFLTRFRQK
jgi:hypothetical protein